MGNDLELTQPQYFKLAFAGFCAVFVGIGLSRFAYTPLLPILIKQQWITPAESGYVGAANFAGYLLGAFLGQHSCKYIASNKTILLSFIISVLSIGLSALNFGFFWLCILRFIVGMTGALLMVLTPSEILKHVPQTVLGRMSGFIFTGIGCGIIFSGSILPPIAHFNLSLAWVAIAFLAFIATIIAFKQFTQEKFIQDQQLDFEQQKVIYIEENAQPIIHSLLLAYSLYAIGMVPYTLFLVDYIHISLQLDLVRSGMFWSLFGIGAFIGPFVLGAITNKIGLLKSLLLSYLIAVIAMCLIVMNKVMITYLLSSILMGALLSTIVSLTSSNIFEVVGPLNHHIVWSRATIYFATSQMLAAYLMSYLINLGMSYHNCFMIGAVAFLFGFLLIIRIH